jgi:hypothetical protein
MGSIETTYDLARDLTIVKATGKMKPDDFQEWTAEYYKGKVTSLCIWDLTQADLSALKTNDLIDDAKQTKSLSSVRKGGKTAIVTGHSLAYGLSRMLEVYYDIENVPFEVQVFDAMDKAEKWLSV